MPSCGCASGARRCVGVLIFLAYLVPPSILFIPLSTVIFNYGLFDTPLALILIYPTILIPFSTWLLMGYFKTIPYELEECALIDGASRWQILTKIVLPLAVPGLISAFIFCFTLCWNEFIYALTFLSSTQQQDGAGRDRQRVRRRRHLPLGLADGRRAGRLAAAGHPLRVLRRALRLGHDRRGEGVTPPRCGLAHPCASRTHHFKRRARGEFSMAQNTRIGWIGMGRMGYPMAERLLKAGYDVSIWNRTKSKAEPLAKVGGKVVDKLSELSGCDIVFSIVAEGKDVEQVYFGNEGVLSTNKTPPVFVDCSTIAVEESVEIRKRLKERGADFVCAPVSGNAKVIKAGKLSSVCSGPKAAYDKAEPMIKVFAPKGVSYVGEGELARVCKIAHNVMLGVVIQNLIEITLLVNKLGVPRHAFLAFLNNGVMGSMFTAYKSPALVNLDWTTTFTPELLRKDLDLGLALADEVDVPMPVTAATRAILQMHMGHAMLHKNPEEYLAKDFATLMETMALSSGMKLESENKQVPTGLE